MTRTSYYRGGRNPMFYLRRKLSIMRRLPIFGLLFLLFASGWSPVLAAACRPRGEGHAGTSAAALDHPVKDCAHCAAHYSGVLTTGFTSRCARRYLRPATDVVEVFIRSRPDRMKMEHTPGTYDVNRGTFDDEICERATSYPPTKAESAVALDEASTCRARRARRHVVARGGGLPIHRH